MQFCKIAAGRNNSRQHIATNLQFMGLTVNLPASGVLATPLSAAGFFVVQVKFLTFIVIGNRADSYKIPQLRKAADVNCKLSEVSDNLKSSNWQFIFSLIVPFCFHVYFLAHFCINFPLYFFVPIFESSFLCQFSIALFCIIFWLKFFVSAFLANNFCAGQNFGFLYHFFFIFKMLPSISIKKACS